MDLAQLSTLIALLAGLSAAAERLTETLKNMIPVLSKNWGNYEGWRRFIIQALPFLSSLITLILLGDIGGLQLNANWKLIGMSLLVSGGSGFWNSILGYMEMVNKLKKKEVKY